MNYTKKGEWILKQHGITSKILSGDYVVAEGIFNKANAHLIAAAPEMYEALKAVLEGSSLDPSNPGRIWERQTPSSKAILKAFEALAKTEGK